MIYHIDYNNLKTEVFLTHGAIISPAQFNRSPSWDWMCCVDNGGNLLKDKFIGLLQEGRKMVADAFGLKDNEFQMSKRLWHTLQNDRDLNAFNPEIQPFKFKDGLYDLSEFNEGYFSLVSEIVNVACNHGVWMYGIVMDDCHDTLRNSPWEANRNGVNGIYSPEAIPYIERWARRFLDALTTFKINKISNPDHVCPRDNAGCDGRFKDDGRDYLLQDQPAGVECMNEPTHPNSKNIIILIMRILQENERYRRLIADRKIMGARFLRPGSQEEQPLFREISRALYLAKDKEGVSLRGPGVSGTILWKSVHNFMEIESTHRFPGTHHLLACQDHSDGVIISTDGDNPKPTERKLYEATKRYLGYRRPQRNRAYRGRCFAFEHLVDTREDNVSFRGMCRAIREDMDRV